MRSTAPRRINPAQSRISYTYMRGSAAPAYPQEEYGYRPKGRPENEEKKVKTAQQQIYHYTRYREKTNPSVFYALFAIIAVVFCSIAFLSVNANISALNAKIKETQALTQKTNAANERLENMLSSAVDMDEVKKTAVTRLGMQTAAPYQIVTINVEKDSYSVQYEDKVADSGKKTFLEKIGLK